MQPHDTPAEIHSAPELAPRVALGDLGPEVAGWLIDAFRRHVVDGLPIETALRLDRTSRLRARDDALRLAAAELTLAGDRPWNVALRLAQAIARHQRKRGAPTTPLECALRTAFAADLGVPTTQRGLYDVIR